MVEVNVELPGRARAAPPISIWPRRNWTMSTDKIRSKAREDSRQATPEREDAQNLERHMREALNALVREQVLHGLGKPANLLRVQVWPLWGGSYRVNVFVGASMADARILHSFFLLTDPEGIILES